VRTSTIHQAPRRLASCEIVISFSDDDDSIGLLSDMCSRDSDRGSIANVGSASYVFVQGVVVAVPWGVVWVSL
jgi:hypothetical protein